MIILQNRFLVHPGITGLCDILAAAIDPSRVTETATKRVLPRKHVNKTENIGLLLYRFVHLM